MNTIEKIGYWGDTHHPKWMDIFRIGLGAIIFYKGIQFSSNIEDLRAMIPGRDLTIWTFMLSHYIAMAHLAGGILIILGLITRWAIIFQLPILIGAVILTGKESGMFDIYSTFWLSFIVLCFLVIFLVYGSGAFSVDEYLNKHPGG